MKKEKKYKLIGTRKQQVHTKLLAVKCIDMGKNAIMVIIKGIYS